MACQLGGSPAGWSPTSCRRNGPIVVAGQLLAHMLLLIPGAGAQQSQKTISEFNESLDAASETDEAFSCPAQGCPCTDRTSQCLEEVGDDLCVCRNSSETLCASSISQRLCPKPQQQQQQQQCCISGCWQCANGNNFTEIGCYINTEYNDTEEDTGNGVECLVCMDQYVLVNGSCVAADDAIRETRVHIKQNLALLGGPTIFGLLEACLAGTGDCYTATELAARAFLYHFEDAFDGIVVFPSKRLPGALPPLHYWSGRSLRNSSGNLTSLYVLQNLGQNESTAATSFVHHLCMRWNTSGLAPIEVVPDSPGQWGMTVLDRVGALGGFPPGTVWCESGTFPACETDVLIWDFDNGYDGPSAAASSVGGRLSNFELLLMGLRSAAELGELPPLAHCNGPSQTAGSGETPLSCGSLVVLSAAEVDESISEAARAEQIAPGSSLNMVALAVMPTAADVELEASADAWESGPDLEWLSSWVSASAEHFGPATDGLASLSFAVAEAQRRPESADATTTPPSTTRADNTAPLYDPGPPVPTTVEVLMTIHNVSLEKLAADETLFDDFTKVVTNVIAEASDVPADTVSVVLSSGSVRVAASIETESEDAAGNIAHTLIAPETDFEQVVRVAVEDVLEGVTEVTEGPISVTGLAVATKSTKESEKDGASRPSLPRGHNSLLLHGLGLPLFLARALGCAAHRR